MNTDRLNRLIGKVTDSKLRLEFELEQQEIKNEQERWNKVIEQRTRVLFTENEELKMIIQEHTRRYEKAIREIQFYKKKCHEMSSSDDWSLSRSCSMMSMTSSQSGDSTYSRSSGSRPSVSSSPIQRSSVYQADSVEVQERKGEGLVYGGSDGLWDTIAKNQGSSDVTIEKLINNFLRRGGSPNTAKQSPSYKKVKEGYGLIHAMIVIEAPRPLDLLLLQGANPNAMTLTGLEKVSPCYLAASVGWLSGLQRIVQAGGDLIRSRGEGNKNSLHIAVEKGHFSVVEYIIYHTQGVLNHERGTQGGSLLHYAAISGQPQIVAYIIQVCHIPLTIKDEKGETALHWACKYGRLEVVMLLIKKYKCDPNEYISQKVGTPFDFAKSAGHKKVMDFIKYVGGTTSKKMDRNDIIVGQVPDHLETALAMNGL